MLEPLKDDEQPHWHVTFAVNDADAAAAERLKLGGKVLVSPTDAPYVRLDRAGGSRRDAVHGQPVRG